MSTLTFETMTQAQADTFAPGDVLLVRATAPRDMRTEWLDLPIYGTPAIALTAADKTLTFRAAALGDGGAISFSTAEGSYRALNLGDAGTDFLSIYSIRNRAVWTFDGADEVSIGGPGGIAVHAGAGADRIRVDNADGPNGMGLPTGDYLIDGGDGNDMLDLRLATAHLTAWGGAGADTIRGGRGNDHLFGNAAGAPTPGDAADTIDGGGGSDYIQGNAGNDMLFGGAGDDRLYGGADDDYLGGGDGQDYLQGNRGRDMLDGDGGNDVLRGGADADTLDGGAGDDLLMGDAGDDVLRGGRGLDLIYGGAGNDIFAFGGGDANFAVGGSRANLTDAIADFAHGSDRIAFGFAAQAVLTDPIYYFDTVAGAAEHAEFLMSRHPGDREVVSLTVGSDTMLFFASGGGNMPDAAVRLIGIDAATMTLADFA